MELNLGIETCPSLANSIAQRCQFSLKLVYRFNVIPIKILADHDLMTKNHIDIFFSLLFLFFCLFLLFIFLAEAAWPGATVLMGQSICINVCLHTYIEIN